jgi:hypothetical protein
MAARTNIYRFVVIYMHEAREIPGAPEIWRGQVTYVSSSPPGGEIGSRAAFTTLEELPGILRSLLQASGVQCPPETAREKCGEQNTRLTDPGS